MTYSTRSFHPTSGPCEFHIYDAEATGRNDAPQPVVFAVGRLCVEEGTHWPNGVRRSSLSQATTTASNAIGALKHFRMNHSMVDEELNERGLRRAPELGALLGRSTEPALVVDESLFDAQRHATNTAAAESIENGAFAPEMQ